MDDIPFTTVDGMKGQPVVIYKQHNVTESAFDRGIICEVLRR